jgi:hypothetical protein
MRSNTTAEADRSAGARAHLLVHGLAADHPLSDGLLSGSEEDRDGERRDAQSL